MSTIDLISHIMSCAIYHVETEVLTRIHEEMTDDSVAGGVHKAGILSSINAQSIGR